MSELVAVSKPGARPLRLLPPVLLLLVPFLALAFVPLTPRNVTFTWDAYAGADSFGLYHSDSVVVPLTNWVCLTNFSGTNTQFSIQVVPGAHFYYLTASNMWGQSGPSNVANTPPVATDPTNVVLKVGK